MGIYRSLLLTVVPSLFISDLAAAQTPQPVMLFCVTIYEDSDGNFQSADAEIDIVQPFEISLKESRLQFVDAEMRLEGTRNAIQIEALYFADAVSPERAGQFSEIRSRFDDDDAPTLFVLDGIEYEARSPTSWNLLTNTADGIRTFKNPDSVEIEFRSLTTIENAPSLRKKWVGQCLLRKAAK